MIGEGWHAGVQCPPHQGHQQGCDWQAGVGGLTTAVCNILALLNLRR